jgi:hypothetical protein
MEWLWSILVIFVGIALGLVADSYIGLSKIF